MEPLTSTGTAQKNGGKKEAKESEAGTARWIESWLMAIRQNAAGEKFEYGGFSATGSVSDTDPLNPEPDPVILAEYQSGSGSRILMTKIFFLYFLFKNCNLFLPRPPHRTSKLQEKPSPLK
jgi:hypothetical protein